MNEELDTIAQLSEKLSVLMNRQESFQREIEDLRQAIVKLQLKSAERLSATGSEELKEQPLMSDIREQLLQQHVKTVVPKEKKRPVIRMNIEKFIGENLINKIGITITVIGVGIGAKYAIDHQFISPLTRIILGYLVGFGLLGFAYRLRKEYENFSSVLLSGSMAIFYFMTFAAYDFYALIPLTLAFILMVLFTILTVIAAIRYNRQVIAHIGLVGAYAVPFLLSDNSGRVVILFSYMAIINAGILVIAFRKYWKPLYYVSFLLTWLIFLTWFIPKHEFTGYFGLSWTFISIFFVTFYFIFLSYKLLKKEKFAIDDILLLLANSFIFFGSGYVILSRHIGGETYQGLFTLGNAMIYYVASFLIYRRKEADRNLFYFTAGLVITFITIAIPVQFDGNWVSQLWAVEAAALFWIGRTKNTAAYELLAYPLMVLAFFSIAFSWPDAYHIIRHPENSIWITPLFNTNFLTSLIFIASFSFINILNVKKQYTPPIERPKELRVAMNFMMPAMLLAVCYFAFYMEIISFWNSLYANTTISPEYGLNGIHRFNNENIPHYKAISILMYSLLFFSLLSLINILKLKKKILGRVNLAFNAFMVLMFLTAGLFALGALREAYLSHEGSQYFSRSFMDIGIRYIAFLFLALMLFSIYRYVWQEFIGTNLRMFFDFLFHITVLTIAGNELINWMDLSGSEHSYKLGLSILFGVYALLLIVMGIWKKKLHLRIGAIVLFSLTLLKLFFYDLRYLDTISKTIVFVVLGVLLLVISFLYTKYKKVIFEDKAE